MGKITGFLEYERSDRHYQPVEERVRHWQEFVLPLPEAETRTQAARCMDCGIPYCHTGCPVNNQIPDSDRAGWESLQKALVAADLLKEPVDLDKVYTNRFLPQPKS